MTKEHSTIKSNFHIELGNQAQYLIYLKFLCKIFMNYAHL